MCYDGLPSILWHQMQSSQALSYISYVSSMNDGNANERQMKRYFFCVRLTRFRSSKIKRPFLIDVANDKRTQIPFACRLAFATFFFFSTRLIYSITCYTNNCIIKDLYLPHSELWYYYSSHLCAHTGYGFVGNTHTNIANDYRVSLSELCVGLLCASNE